MFTGEPLYLSAEKEDRSVSPDNFAAQEALAEKFANRFGKQPRILQAPARVNLIGEHTDYNDGFVLPAAIQFHTSVAIAPRTDDWLRVYSENYGEKVEFRSVELPDKARNHWSDYVVGVALRLLEQGTRLPGADVWICGDVPQGAGLSSSASLEVAVCGAFLQAASTTMEGESIARLCQKAENEFVGARCGIMDQFVSVHGRKDHALLLDCRSLEYACQPLPHAIRLVICNTMVRHAIAGGEYNQRRKECEAGAKFFAERKAGVRALRDVSMAEFRRYEAELPEPVRRRCRHVIAENERVLQSAEALARHDLEQFGQFMRQSHESLRDDFDVSCAELDLMAELAWKHPGVYGARMTGGGFGGCTINLVKREEVEAFRSSIAAEYGRATGKHPEIYVCSAADGMKLVA
jgi:galactokinase